MPLVARDHRARAVPAARAATSAETLGGAGGRDRQAPPASAPRRARRPRERRDPGPDDRLGGALAADRAARRRLRRAAGRACCAPRFVRETVVPLLALVALGAAIGPVDLAVGRATTLVIAGALRIDELTLVLTLHLRRGRDRRGAAVVARASRRARRPTASTTRCCCRAGGHGRARAAREPRDGLPRPRAAVDPALRAVRDRDAARALARVGPEVPHHRLGRLGDAALRARVPLRRDRRDRLRRDRRGRSRRRCRRRRCCSPASRWRSSASPSRPRSRRSTSGRPTSTRARRRRSPRSWRWRRRPPRSACILRLFDVALIDAATTGGRRSRRWRRSRSSSATSARSGSRRSSGCSRTRRSRRPATCWPASSWRRSSACRRRSSTSPSTWS